jgi:peptidoglycan/LPS O-acetylase OafA/YrhL
MVDVLLGVSGWLARAWSRLTGYYGASVARDTAIPQLAKDKTGRTQHVDALTGVRGFAAMWVFAFHTWIVALTPTLAVGIFGMIVDLTPLAKFGWLGLDVFFTLSGFLLTRQATLRRLNHAGPYRVSMTAHTVIGEPYFRYLRRRILRVFPAYYACLTAIVLLTANGIYTSVPGRLEMFLHLAMAHNVVEKYIATMNGVFWTLPFEWNFYLVFPLLYFILYRYGKLALYALTLAIVLAVKIYVLKSGNGYVQLFLPLRLDEFVAGMCAGALATSVSRRRAWTIGAFWIGVGLLLATPWLFSSYPGVHNYYDLKGFFRPVWIEISVCLLLLGLSGSRHAAVGIFDNKVAIWLGLISYSVYLFHAPLLQLLPVMGLVPVRSAGVQPSWAHLFAVAIPVTILVSTLSYHLIERPFQRAPAQGVVRSDKPRPSRRPKLKYPLFALIAWAGCLMLLTMQLN